MAAKVAATKAVQPAQTLGMAPAIGTPTLVSPYDGTIPGASPIGPGVMPGSLGALDGGRPQVNATHQSALATNGSVNQNVTNNNTYKNFYIVQGGGLFGGAFSGWQGLGPNGSQAYIDPLTGAVVQRKSGLFGWLGRLIRGY